jgi:hypothetical protein
MIMHGAVKDLSEECSLKVFVYNYLEDCGNEGIILRYIAEKCL